MIGKNKISGVVCEFNPLHNGHAALLSRISEEFGSDTVCVMSGNFVQRGEAAVLDKWSRTRLALQNGAALVTGAALAVGCGRRRKICTRRHFVIKCARLRRYTDVWQRNRRYRSPHALRGILALRCI